MAVHRAAQALAILPALLPVLSMAQQPKVFYAIGSAEYIAPDTQHPERSPYKDVRLYEVDSATLRVLKSVSVERETPGFGSGKVWMQSGMLTEKRDAIILTDAGLGDSIIMRVSAPKLEIENQISIKSLHVRGTECLDHIFIHPVSGLAYFSCDSGSRGNGFVILDTVKNSVAGDFAEGPPTPSTWPRLSLFRPQFAYARESGKLYLTGDDVMAVDLQNRPLDYIVARDVARAAGLNVGKFQYSIKKLAVLPEGKLVILVTDGHTATLAVYDPLGRKLLSHWTETQKYAAMETYTDQRTGKPFEKPVQEIAQLHCGPVPSRDGSRLFAMSEGDVILWDSGTLEELDRFDAPEPPGETDRCFYPAPDGHGMWFAGQSGKVYRLDDQTGHVIEEVKLPFRLLTLIHEP